MGKTYRRYDKDEKWRNVKRARAAQDQFHSKREHTREVQVVEPILELDIEALAPRAPRKNLEAYGKFRPK